MLKHSLMLALGWLFIILGIAGLVLPFLQGVLFLAIGIGILGRHSEWAGRRIEALRRRYPRIAQKVDDASAEASGWFKRLTGRSREG